MIHFHNVNTDVVKLRLVPFALKNNAKRWMYSLLANSLSNWNHFVRSFCENIFLMAKPLN